MKSEFVLEGSGEELLAQAEKWKNRSHLKLVEVASPAEKYRNSLPPDVQWEGNVPLIPLRGRVEPLTNEMVRDLLEDGE